MKPAIYVRGGDYSPETLPEEKIIGDNRTEIN